MKNRIALLAFLIIFLFLTFLILKQITIKNIVLIGNKNLTEKNIRDLIGVKEGSSAILPFSKTIYERLKKSPWVKEATVRKDLNGTLTIYIREATPVAILQFEDKAYLIDEDVNILEELENLSEDKIFLPVIKDIQPKNKETLAEAVNLVVFIAKNKVIPMNERLYITGKFPDDITLHINNLSIIVGKGDFEKKFARLSIVNEEIQKRKLQIRYVDLRVPDRVIVKPEEERK